MTVGSRWAQLAAVYLWANIIAFLSLSSEWRVHFHTSVFCWSWKDVFINVFFFFSPIYIFFFFSVFRNRTTCTKNLIQNRTGVHTIVNTQIPRVSHHTTIVEFQVPSLRSWVIGFEVSCVSILGLKSKIFFFPNVRFWILFCRVLILILVVPIVQFW